MASRTGVLQGTGGQMGWRWRVLCLSGGAPSLPQHGRGANILPQQGGPQGTNASHTLALSASQDPVSPSHPTGCRPFKWGWGHGDPSGSSAQESFFLEVSPARISLYKGGGSLRRRGKIYGVA